MTSPSGARAVSQPCKLFVGGLSSLTTTEALRLHFQKYGRLVDAVVMSKNGRPRGFGFVSFESAAGAVAALAESQWLDGRMVDVKRAVPGEQTQERPCNKVFVGGLPQDADTEDLRAHFVRYGPVGDAVVMVDRRTKRSRGFGFVRFANGAAGAAAAEAVMADAANHRMAGKWIEVKRATPAALLRDPIIGAKDVSPCSSGRTSSTCTPSSGGPTEQEQRQQAYLAWELANKMDGFDCTWGMGLAGAAAAAATGFGGPAASGQGGRRTRRSRRGGSGSGTAADLAAAFGGNGAHISAFAAAAAAAAAGDEAAVYAAAGLWGLGAGANTGREFAEAAAWLRAAGLDAAGLPAWVGAGAGTGAGDDILTSDRGMAADDDEEGSASSQPPPGLGSAERGLSPMKVRCYASNAETTCSDGVAVEDFMATEVRPWLSAC